MEPKVGIHEAWNFETWNGSNLHPNTVQEIWVCIFQDLGFHHIQREKEKEKERERERERSMNNGGALVAEGLRNPLMPRGREREREKERERERAVFGPEKNQVHRTIRLMDKILHYFKYPKLWELWNIPYNG